MKDIQRILELNLALYKKYNIPVAKLEEFVFGFKWAMAVDSNKKISFALRIGKEKPVSEYEPIIRGLIGKPLDECITELMLKDDVTLRTLLVVLSNLMSKPFNSVELLEKRGIKRTTGLGFDYDVSNMKVGLIGYGVYLRFLLNKCKEFHAFDLTPEKRILSYRPAVRRLRYAVFTVRAMSFLPTICLNAVTTIFSAWTQKTVTNTLNVHLHRCLTFPHLNL